MCKVLTDLKLLITCVIYLCGLSFGVAELSRDEKDFQQPAVHKGTFSSRVVRASRESESTDERTARETHSDQPDRRFSDEAENWHSQSASHGDLQRSIQTARRIDIRNGSEEKLRMPPAASSVIRQLPYKSATRIPFSPNVAIWPSGSYGNQGYFSGSELQNRIQPTPHDQHVYGGSSQVRDRPLRPSSGSRVHETYDRGLAKPQRNYSDDAISHKHGHRRYFHAHYEQPAQSGDPVDSLPSWSSAEADAHRKFPRELQGGSKGTGRGSPPKRSVSIRRRSPNMLLLFAMYMDDVSTMVRQLWLNEWYPQLRYALTMAQAKAASASSPQEAQRIMNRERHTVLHRFKQQQMNEMAALAKRYEILQRKSTVKYFTAHVQEVLKHSFNYMFRTHPTKATPVGELAYLAHEAERDEQADAVRFLPLHREVPRDEDTADIRD